MSLGDDATGRPGFLDLLGGLNNSQELKGSDYLDTNKVNKTVGWQEMGWIEAHWPKLKKARFCQDRGMVSDMLDWLKTGRSRIKMWSVSEVFGGWIS
ncbi:hypothetical protein BGX29_007135 [Mortierella sp. GBA35]|nr:hypothetical protein BGX29_007135 [Mortierella sp. GBA35]